MDHIQNILSKLKVSFVLDDDSQRLEPWRTPKDTVSIVVSRKAIRNYDPHHPERVLCILTKSTVPNLSVIVKNREINLEKNIAFWLQKKYDISNCDVCYDDLLHAKHFSNCHGCNLPVRINKK